MNIPIMLELSEGLKIPSDSDSIDLLKHQLEHDVEKMLNQIGLSGEASVEVSITPNRRVLQVWVQKRLLPYSPDFMKRVWSVSMPKNWLDWPDQFSDSFDLELSFPDGWLTRGVQFHSTPDSQDQVVRFLGRLASEVIAGNPDSFITFEQAERYWKIFAADCPQLETRFTALDIHSLLSHLLKLGIVTINVNQIVPLLCEMSRWQSKNMDNFTELIYAQLCSNRLEILLPPQDLKEIVPGASHNRRIPVYDEIIDESFREKIRLMEDGLFYELGLYLPTIYLTPAPDLSSGLIAFRINDRMGFPIRGLEKSELLVNKTVEVLNNLHVKARSAVNPANGKSSAIIDIADEELVADISTTLWNPAEFVILALSGEIRQKAHMLISSEGTEYLLGTLDKMYPALISAVIDKYSSSDITRVLRSLLHEGISIRNLRGIFERLLDFDTISGDYNQHIVLDSRLLVSEGTTLDKANNWMNYREFVRNGLKQYLSHKYSLGQGVLTVFLLDPKLEILLEQAANGVHTVINQQDQVKLREVLWQEINQFQKPDAILTSSSCRSIMRDWIAPELPNLPVLAYTELSPDLSIQPLARITL